MTEVPEHLLARSRARRAAATGQPADAGAPATTGGEVEPAGAASPATAAAATPVPATAPAPPPPPKPDPPYIRAYKERKKIPWWALPAVVSLPLWAILYIFTLETPGAGANDPLTLGQGIYSGKCASCHGAAGEGAVGPALNGGGDLAQVFPEYKDHIAWVETGSAGATSGTYGATKKPVKGGMPAWKDSLTPAEIVEVVRYEREVLNGHAPEADLVSLSQLAAAGQDITPYLDGTTPIPPPAAG